MPNLKKLTIKTAFLSCIILSFILGIHIAKGAFADPGTDDDPIVAKSYVDEQINKLKAQIPGSANASQYAILENLKAGQKVLSGENSEIIVRVGSCKTINGTLGRLADLTSDTSGDLAEGTPVPLNHLIYSARNDGRGIAVETDGSVVVVRGSYTLN